MAEYAPGTPRVIGPYVRPFCKCGHRLTVKTAWTPENPGKRFIACPDYDTRSKCAVFQFFYDDLPSDYYRELLFDLHSRVRRGTQTTDMQEHIGMLSMEKARLVQELTVSRAKLQLYDRIFVILVGVLLVLCVVLGMRFG
ncbi:hypothetical protein CTI12_AA422550 [Artemisia annua]|uniref:GRF-type domain-containing protein n=1 Tax=Artemisia annua TaxID=35608 RepID=A0A2U1M2X2_ARTAN|nr:hypothetical protein CTI12_AA422550 [Artemisia annua]